MSETRIPPDGYEKVVCKVCGGDPPGRCEGCDGAGYLWRKVECPELDGRQWTEFPR